MGKTVHEYKPRLKNGELTPSGRATQRLLAGERVGTRDPDVGGNLSSLVKRLERGGHRLVKDRESNGEVFYHLWSGRARAKDSAKGADKGSANGNGALAVEAKTVEAETAVERIVLPGLEDVVTVVGLSAPAPGRYQLMLRNGKRAWVCEVVGVS